MELRLPGQKLRKLRTEAAKYLNSKTPSIAREVSCLSGKLNLVAQTVPSRPSILQNVTKGFSKGPRPRESIIRDSLSLVRSSEGRANMVDKTTYQMEREKSSVKETRLILRIERVPTGSGSVMSGNLRGRTVVSRGERGPHELPRAFSSIVGDKNVSERSKGQTGVAPAGQSNSSSIRKQFGWDSLRPGNNDCKEVVDVVPQKGNIVVSAIPS